MRESFGPDDRLLLDLERDDDVSERIASRPRHGQSELAPSTPQLHRLHSGRLNAIRKAT